MKKLFTFIVLTLFIFGLFGSVSFFAQDGGVEVFKDSHTHINPIYEDLITQEHIADPPPMTLSSDGNYIYTAAGAGDVLRKGMLSRQEKIYIHYKTTVSGGVPWDQIFDEAMKHTGNPKEGDYLRYHYGGYKADADGYTIGGYAFLTLTYSISYYTTYGQESSVNAEVQKVVYNIIDEGMSDYEKVCAIYDYICDNVTYDFEHLEDPEYMLKFTTYGALMDKTAVCQGYASLFYRLALEAGVDARVITGKSYGQNHAWNIVKLDGKYYNLDSTWDSSNAETGNEYEYFLKSPGNFTNHNRGSEFTSRKFNNQYPMAETDYSSDGNSGGLGDVTDKEDAVPNDVNGDGEFDVLDVICVRGYFAGKIKLTEQQKKTSDITKDGVITMLDVFSMIGRFLSGNQ